MVRYVLRACSVAEGSLIMGLGVMILGLLLFLGVHVLTALRDLRARLIAMVGETVYKIGYALASTAGLALIGRASCRERVYLEV
jgi:hypothetical protein